MPWSNEKYCIPIMLTFLNWKFNIFVFKPLITLFRVELGFWITLSVQSILIIRKMIDTFKCWYRENIHSYIYNDRTTLIFNIYDQYNFFWSYIRYPSKNAWFCMSPKELYLKNGKFFYYAHAVNVPICSRAVQSRDDVHNHCFKHMPIEVINKISNFPCRFLEC